MSLIRKEKSCFFVQVLAVSAVIAVLLSYCNRYCGIKNITESYKPFIIGSPRGFVMGLDYSDQITAGSVNVFNLQCFFGHHVKGVIVIEPFIHPMGSVFGISLSPSYTLRQRRYKIKPEELNLVKLSDIFDIKEWQVHSSEKKYSPLANWSYFIQNCPRKLILVYHKWVPYAANCNLNMMMDATKEFILENNFEEIRNVCIDFTKTGVLSPEEFVDTIYGPFNPRETVVIFNKWGGIHHHISDFRYAINSGTSCTRGQALSMPLIHHSAQILKDTKEYLRKYMNRSEEYVAVMFRLGHFLLNHKISHMSAEYQRRKLNWCFNEINMKVKAIEQERGINATLLMMDVGKYGAEEFRGTQPSDSVNMTVLNQTVQEFFKSFFSNHMTQDIWEESFKTVAKFHVPGYIAVMQKSLAANSTCLLLAGGGTFQGHAKQLYNELHPKSKCVVSLCH